MRRYEKDAADPALGAWVRKDATIVRRLGASLPPAYTVNGRMHVGWGGWDILRGAVVRQRKEADALLAQRKTLADVQALRAKENTRNEAAFESYKATILGPLAKTTKTRKR